jgi:hypothetical protein
MERYIQFHVSLDSSILRFRLLFFSEGLAWGFLLIVSLYLGLLRYVLFPWNGLLNNERETKAKNVLGAVSIHALIEILHSL